MLRSCAGSLASAGRRVLVSHRGRTERQGRVEGPDQVAHDEHQSDRWGVAVEHHIRDVLACGTPSGGHFPDGASGVFFQHELAVTTRQFFRSTAHTTEWTTMQIARLSTRKKFAELDEVGLLGQIGFSVNGDCCESNRRYRHPHPLPENARHGRRAIRCDWPRCYSTAQAYWRAHNGRFKNWGSHAGLKGADRRLLLCVTSSRHPSVQMAFSDFRASPSKRQPRKCRR